MARLVKKEDKGPVEIKPSDKSVFVCTCGLSKNQPFCDGSHKMTADEKEGVNYIYDQDGQRTEVN